MGATLKDIAREAGINVSTASRSLSGAYGVNAETRRRVQQIAERLNYRPNLVARGLVTGRSHTLALLVSDIRNPFFAEVARGVEDAARDASCDLILCNSDFDVTKQMSYLTSLREKRVDGVLVNSVASMDEAQVKEMEALGMPVVLLNRLLGSASFSTVTSNNVDGGRQAAEYLWRLGHRHIAHLTGPLRHGNLTDRERGFCKALAAAGAEPPVVLHGENSTRGGLELAKQLLERHPEVTAVFAASDSLAFGVARALNERGIAIPGGISLVGFDDVEFSSIVNPSLTTVRQQKYEIGRAAAELVMRRVGQGAKAEPEHLVFDVSLVERASCAPPHANRARIS